MKLAFNLALSLYLIALLPNLVFGAENCANVLSNGGFLFASWGAVSLSPESEMGTFWETQMKNLCNQIECPIFCSEDSPKVPAALRELQKKCREKDTAACDSFFTTLKIEDRDPTHTCFYVGGKACDFCDRFGGEYCSPGMRFGRFKPDYEDITVHKIACKAGFSEACDILNKRMQETTEANQKKCDESGTEEACRAVISQLVDLGKIKEALEKSIEVCRKSQYQTCKTFIFKGHKDMPSSRIDSFSKQFQEALEPECKKSKKAEPCFYYAEFVKKSQPQVALDFYRAICKGAPAHNLSEAASDACRTVFSESLKMKRFAEAQSVLKIACQSLKEAQLRNGVRPTKCFYEDELKEARKKKA